MTEPAYLLSKAIDYKNEIEKILSETRVSFTDFKSNEDKRGKTFDNKTELKLKIKLLFSEFENGEILIQQLSEIDNERYLREDISSGLLRYQQTLQLFIDHLNDYRITKPEYIGKLL
jgi:hypothetical protein